MGTVAVPPGFARDRVPRRVAPGSWAAGCVYCAPSGRFGQRLGGDLRRVSCRGSHRPPVARSGTARVLFPFGVVQVKLAASPGDFKRMIEFPDPEPVSTNGIELAVYSAGDGPPVLLLHGFPELAFSWRHQLPALAAAGYRAIAPDLRGYGGSSKPEAVDAYGIETLVADVTGLLDALGEREALVVAHDWGALLAWQLALLEPGRVRGVASLGIPFIARSERDPIELMRERFGERFYIVDFQDSDEADRRFAAEPRRFIDCMLRRDVITRERFEALPPALRVISLREQFAREEPPGRPLLSGAELDVYARAFEAGGFRGPINWYRNFSHNWRVTEGVPQRVEVPTLFIGAANDVVIHPQQVEAMKHYVPDLELHVLESCGHWIQQERPADTNRLLLDWLGRRFPPG